MRWLLLTASLVATLTLASSVGAQAREDEGPAVTVEVHTERPPEGSLRRGYFAAPGWALYLGGGILALGAAGALALRFRRRAARGVGERRS